MGVSIRPWSEGDLPLLTRCLADPAMTEHIGGPESPEKIAERQGRYQQPGSRQFVILDERTSTGVGWVGFWDREWRDQPVYETGWAVIPEFQGRGCAGAAMAELCAVATAERSRRFMHAYPSVDNAPSNAVCRKVGFELAGPVEFEYPKGHPMHCNDWRFDLFAET